MTTLTTSDRQYLTLRLSILAIAVVAVVVLVLTPTGSTTTLTQDDVQVEAKNVLADEKGTSITLTRNCGCKAKEAARLTNLTDAHTVRQIQILGTDGAVLAEWDLPLLPNDAQVIRMPDKEKGSLRISKK